VEVHDDVRAHDVRELRDTYPDFDDGISVEDRAHGAALIAQMARDVREAQQSARDYSGGGGGP
jgi:hypothetical protein